jgi:lipopolysaccharide/colanic/teichoic acid biosynthesis glycosyltransferase
VGSKLLIGRPLVWGANQDEGWREMNVVEEIQKRIDDIQTEATRLLVFANSIRDTALAIRLKKTARVIFKSATGIEKQLAKLKSAA